MRRIAPGLLLALVVAAVALAVARVVPLVGAPVLAILIGAALRSVAPAFPEHMLPGLRFASHGVLQAAIVVSGFGLSFGAVLVTGITTFPVTLGTIAVALVLAPLVGRRLGLDTTMQRLVGIGTAICGASAIAAVSTVLEPSEAETATAIATVFFYNVVAVLAFPPLGHLMHLTQSQFGVWAGTAINDTSSVVAAGYTYGLEAGDHATIVKLARATLILPIVAVLAFVRAREHTSSGPIPWMKIVPWFIVWFVVAALIDTAGAVPAGWHGAIGFTSTALITVALAAIGCGTDLVRLVRTGAAPLCLGLVLWVAIALSSLAIQRASGL